MNTQGSTWKLSYNICDEVTFFLSWVDEFIWLNVIWASASHSIRSIARFIHGHQRANVTLGAPRQFADIASLDPKVCLCWGHWTGHELLESRSQHPELFNAIFRRDNLYEKTITLNQTVRINNCIYVIFLLPSLQMQIAKCPCSRRSSRYCTSHSQSESCSSSPVPHRASVRRTRRPLCSLPVPLLVWPFPLGMIWIPSLLRQDFDRTV